MIVVDASVAVDMLLGHGSQAGDDLATRLATGETICAPHLIDAEVGQVLRRFVLRGAIQRPSATAMVRDMMDLQVRRYPHTVLLARSFELMDNVSVYDALYLALAEALGCPLLTGDGALRAVPGCTARVEVLSTSAR